MKKENCNLENLKKDESFCNKIKEYQELSKKVEELNKTIDDGKSDSETYNKKNETDMNCNMIAKILLDEIIENLFSDLLTNGLPKKNKENENKNCIVRVDYGYNGLLNDKLYFANIHKHLVDFYADDKHTCWIPQRLFRDDVTEIENPSQEEMLEAATNGMNAYRIYKDGEKKYQEIKEQKERLKNKM